MNDNEQDAQSVITYGAVEFQGPKSGRRVGARARINSAYFLALAIWSVVGSWSRHPALGVVAALVYLELGLAATRVSSLIGGVVYEEALAARVAPIVIELCSIADCAVPRVAFRDDALRSALVRPLKGGGAQLVLAKPFVLRVDDAPLRAVMAHEISHLVSGDLRRAKGRARLAVGISAVGTGVVYATTPSTGVVLPVYLAGTLVLLFGLLAAFGTRNRELEWRADLDAVRLCGDAASLADGLGAVRTLSDESRQRVFGPAPWRWILSPLSWRMPTHPPMEQRIARLRSLSAPS